MIPPCLPSFDYEIFVYDIFNQDPVFKFKLQRNTSLT